MQRLKNLGQDDDAVALAFGVNKLTVQNTLALLDCSKPVQKAVEGGFIALSDARFLSRLTPAQQTAKVEEIVKAVVGKEGHARVKAKRAVLATASTPGEKPPAPKMKGRKEIAAKMKEISEAGPLYADVRKGWREALEWMLGGEHEPEKDTKTRDLVDELEKTPAG
jgi:ParB family chromosome partitioning protein